METGDLRHALGLYHALNAAMEDAVSANASAGESVASPAPTRQFAAITELVPAAQTVLVRFDPRKIRSASLAEAIMTLPDTPDFPQHLKRWQQQPNTNVLNLQSPTGYRQALEFNRL